MLLCNPDPKNKDVDKKVMFNNMDGFVLLLNGSLQDEMSYYSFLSWLGYSSLQKKLLKSRIVDSNSTENEFQARLSRPWGPKVDSPKRRDYNKMKT